MDLDIGDFFSDSDEEDFQQLMTIYVDLQKMHFLKKNHAHKGFKN
ncbi:hypothetical protein BVRB_6g141830 isoform A [Beta vulgaris subsp. vulgaris]|nr:hypothetical protein BVRB_6g141830 isoform A [Beta vulgaris subsp. vulgaris]